MSITTDFGIEDHYVGQMKGVIAGIAPDATVIDLTHGVPPQSIAVGGYVLAASFGCFPDHTIHCAVVDPGVGTTRRSVCIQTEHAYLVGPDNGLFTAYLKRDPLLRAVQLSNSKFHRQRVSQTFHGRDIFAPVSAYLASGVPFDDLGKEIDGVLMLPTPTPRLSSEGQLEPSVVHIDHFGNLITDLTRQAFESWADGQSGGDPCVMVGTTRVDQICDTFADVADGQVVAYFGSTDRLEIGVRNSHAASTLGMHRGDTLQV